MKNKIIASVIICFIFIPAVSSAAPDARCLTMDECIEIRQNTFSLSEQDAKTNALYQSKETKEICGGESISANGKTQKIGFCYPTTQAKTSIKIAGKTIYTNIGDFIQYIYKYAVAAASIVAVVIIMFAGMQWIMSGGSPDKITASKKKIGDALMGLFLAVMSYAVLNLVNPYLVNMRLPQTWILKPQQLVPTYCEKLSGDKKVAQISQKANETLTDDTVRTRLGTAKFELKSNTQTKCQYKYAVEGEGNQLCTGSACDAKGGKMFVCASSGCIEGQLILKYKMASLIDMLKKINIMDFGAEKDYLDDDTFVFWGVCQGKTKENAQKFALGDKWERWDDNGDEIRKVTSKPGTNYLEYEVALSGFAINQAHDADHWNCPDDMNLVGFLMKSEIGEEWTTYDANLTIGYNHNTKSVKYGVWDKKGGEFVGIKDYIPYNELINGKLAPFIINLDDNTMQKIFANKSIEPESGATL
jgi:hypothetical protein